MKSVEESEYIRIKNFLLWALGIVGVLITALGSIVIILTYSDRNALKEEFAKTVTDLKQEISDLKKDSKETVNETKNNSQSEILKIKDLTKSIAVEETQKELKNIFATDILQSMIRENAILETNRIVDEVAGDKVLTLVKMNDAAIQMRMGSLEGLKKMRYYSIFSSNRGDRIRADYLYKLISESYQKDAENEFRYINRIDIINTKITSDSLRLLSIKRVIRDMCQHDSDLGYDCELIRALSILTKQDFKCFEIEKINEWLKSQKNLPLIDDEKFLPVKPEK